MRSVPEDIFGFAYAAASDADAPALRFFAVDARCSWGRRLSAIAVGVCLIGVHPHPASAAAPVPAGKERPSHVETPATMLELDSDDAALGRRLGASLRRAFAQRGVDDGRRESLAELRLAMGCTDDAPECLARGGRTLGAKTLTYGSVQTTKAGVVIDLTMLAVESAKVSASVRLTVSAADLDERAIDATAERVVADLLDEEVVPAPVEPPPAPPPAPEPTTTAIELPAPAPEPVRKGKYWWGLERPTPKWKWALFGTSVGLVAVSTAGLIGTLVGMRLKRDELVDTANASLQDTYPSGHPMQGQPNTANDVDPTVADDICFTAREHPPDDTANPDSVRNKSVTEVCNEADGLEKGVLASGVLLGVSLAATLASTLVLVLHRNERGGSRAAVRRRWHVSLSPGVHGVGGAVTGRF